MGLTQACNCVAGCSVGGFDSAGWNVGSWPDPEVPTGGPAGPVTEVDLLCRRSEWHGSFGPIADQVVGVGGLTLNVSIKTLTQDTWALDPPSAVLRARSLRPLP